MWYVINKQNGQKLIKFKKRVIIPLFEYMVKYKNESRTDKFVEFLEEISSETNSELIDCNKKIKKHNLKNLCNKKRILEQRIQDTEILKYICKRVVNKVSFVDCIESLLSTYSKLELEMHMYVYYMQNRALKKRKSFIDELKVPDEWNRIFTVFFYEKFFVMSQIWERIDGCSYSREEFHENFKEDNKIFVCPYCDSSDISDNGNLEVEHFWPGSKYPFLSMNPLNLYSSCKACNRPATGKGTKTFNPITLPFYQSIGEGVRFKPNVVERKIHIKGKSRAIDNYIKLINLENRYSKKSGYGIVELLTSTIYSTIKELENHGQVVSDDDIKTYISSKIIPRVQPHYFVVSDILRDYSKYLDFIDSQNGI